MQGEDRRTHNRLLLCPVSLPLNCHDYLHLQVSSNIWPQALGETYLEILQISINASDGINDRIGIPITVQNSLPDWTVQQLVEIDRFLDKESVERRSGMDSP
jgi:hypothetical protein